MFKATNEGNTFEKLHELITKTVAQSCKWTFIFVQNTNLACLRLLNSMFETQNTLYDVKGLF